MNKNNKYNNYRVVDKLPKNAMTVSEYCEKTGLKNPNLYKFWKQHIKDGKKIDFEIVSFKGINFVI